MGTTIVLADAHAMTREGLKLVLQDTGGMTVVGQTDSVEEAVRLSRRLSPDVLAIDSGMLRGHGLPPIRKLIARGQKTNVLVLTDTEDRESLGPIIAAGVRGCIGKNRTAEDLVIAVDLVAAGRMRLPREASRLVQRRVQTNETGLEARLGKLSENEREVLALTARGFTGAEIAARVHLATQSVYNYRSRIMSNLECRTRAELMALCREAGLLERDLSPST